MLLYDVTWGMFTAITITLHYHWNTNIVNNIPKPFQLTDALIGKCLCNIPGQQKTSFKSKTHLLFHVFTMTGKWVQVPGFLGCVETLTFFTWSFKMIKIEQVIKNDQKSG